MSGVKELEPKENVARVDYRTTLTLDEVGGFLDFCFLSGCVRGAADSWGQTAQIINKSVSRTPELPLGCVAAAQVTLKETGSVNNKTQVASNEVSHTTARS